MNNIQSSPARAPRPKSWPVQPKPLRVAATIISYVCHPIFMPVVMAIVLYKLSPISFAGVTQHDFGMYLARIAYTSLFFPLVVVGLLKGLGFLESFQMKDTKDRIIPLMATMIFYFWIYQVFKNTDAPLLLRVLLLGCFWGIIALFMANIFTKVSMHTAAAGGMVGILIVLMMVSHVSMIVPFFAALIIAGIIGTARMLLSAHEIGDIWLGYIIGILVQLGAYVFLK